MRINALTRWFWEATGERVSGIALRAEANGHVIDHETLCADTA